ncbi:MAG: phosphatase PAP2 family protein [Clostridia bacterium]|nr:phosphatase PAP2 family protein [Clostridia bacterium]MBQ4624082.1 phosphatase PAP2 family protein [Clostridia bacterium]
MKKPVTDYRNFRFSKLKSPEFSHLFLLLGWVFYFAMYFLTEKLIPADSCTPVWCPLDDRIPFCEWFLIPYVGWYLLVAGSLLYFALYDIPQFRRLQIFIIVTQVTAMLCYILFPTCQNLRPEIFPRENFLTDCIAFLYTFDTNTGVCPSLHCAYSIGIASVWWKQPDASRRSKWGITLFCALVCLSTVFIKQHSVLDFFAALPVCLLAEGIACGSWWKQRYIHKKKT